MNASTQSPKNAMVTWLLVADGRQAQVYVRKNAIKNLPAPPHSKYGHFEETTYRELTPFGEIMHAEPPDTYEKGRDRVGRVRESASPARRMSESRQDICDEIKQHFAKTVATYLNQAKAANAYHRLVIIAPAKFSASLKKFLGKTAKGSIAAELCKDLTDLEDNELVEHLEGIR